MATNRSNLLLFDRAEMHACIGSYHHEGPGLFNVLVAVGAVNVIVDLQEYTTARDQHALRFLAQFCELTSHLGVASFPLCSKEFLDKMRIERAHRYGNPYLSDHVHTSHHLLI